METNNNNSTADEILKFKSLLDSGVITQEEFDKKKGELLNNPQFSEENNIKEASDTDVTGNTIMVNETNDAGKTNKKGCRGCLKFFVGIVFVFILITVLRFDSIKFREIANVSKTEETKIKDVLEQCGIAKVGSITLDGMDEGGGRSFKITYKDVNSIILQLRKGNSVKAIKYGDNVLYADGGVISKLDDFIMDSSEKNGCQAHSEEAIKALLKSPATAKFPFIDEWVMSKNKGVVTVQSYVDSQNGFGAKIRGEFQIIYDKDLNITSLIFDGKEYIKK